MLLVCYCLVYAEILSGARPSSRHLTSRHICMDFGDFLGIFGDIYNKKFLSLAWFIKKQYLCALFRDKPERVNKFN